MSGRHHFTAFKTPGGTLRSKIEVNHVTPGYLTAIGLPLVRGRDIDASSVRAGRGEVIVNETAARLFFGGDDPVGRTLRDPTEREYLVTGVAHDARLGDLGKLHTPYLFIAATDTDALDITSAIVRNRDVRRSSSNAAVSQELRTAALSLDRDLHLSVNPLRDNLAPYLQGSRLLASLSSILGALALLLATIGIYGTVAFTVARRTREIGIRVALGARSGNVVSLVIAQAMRPVLIGAAVGTFVCAGLSRVLSPVLFGVSPLDRLAFVMVPVFLLAVALLASWVPARRASAVDAMAALRAV